MLCAPYSSLESIVEKSSESYYLALRQKPKAQSGRTNQIGNRGTLFLLRSLLSTSEKRSQKKCEREKKLFLLALPELSVQNLRGKPANYGRVTLAKMIDADRHKP